MYSKIPGGGILHPAGGDGERWIFVGGEWDRRGDEEMELG